MGTATLPDSPRVPLQATQEYNFWNTIFAETQHLIEAEKFLTDATLQSYSRSPHASKPKDEYGEFLTAAQRYFFVARNEARCCPVHPASAWSQLECPCTHGTAHPHPGDPSIAPYQVGKSKPQQ